MPLRRSFGAAGVMSEAEGNGADTTGQAQAAIDAARRARQDRIPSFRRLLEALFVAVGSHGPRSNGAAREQAERIPQ